MYYYIISDSGCIHQIPKRLYQDALKKNLFNPVNIGEFTTAIKNKSSKHFYKIKFNQSLLLPRMNSISKFANIKINEEKFWFSNTRQHWDSDCFKVLFTSDFKYSEPYLYWVLTKADHTVFTNDHITRIYNKIKKNRLPKNGIKENNARKPVIKEVKHKLKKIEYLKNRIEIVKKLRDNVPNIPNLGASTLMEQNIGNFQIQIERLEKEIDFEKEKIKNIVNTLTDEEKLLIEIE